MIEKTRTLLLVALCACLVFVLPVTADVTPLKHRTRLPKITFRHAVPDDVAAYLGLSRKKNFSLGQIGGSLYVIEVFSTYCTSCPKNVPILNDVYRSLERDPRAKRNVKVFGIAIGNTAQEIEHYKTTHQMICPVLSDPDFTIHRILGNPRVPYTILVKKTARGAVLLDTHHGILDSAESVLRKVRSFY